MNKGPVVLFDGVCNFCNTTVDFIFRTDRSGKIKFASLQSAYGQKILKQENRDAENFDTFLFEDNGTIYSKSTAFIKMSRYLGGIWPLTQIFLLVPKFIRDAVYDFVARNRYKWFGKRETCRLPTPEERSRFIE